MENNNFDEDMLEKKVVSDEINNDSLEDDCDINYDEYDDDYDYEDYDDEDYDCDCDSECDCDCDECDCEDCECELCDCEIEACLIECYDDFDEVIQNRGEDYHETGRVVSCIKNNNHFYAKVLGSDDNCYDVSFHVHKYGVDYDCSCPCEFPCKHEYATLLAIENGEYDEVELKKWVCENHNSLKQLIEKIPAEELKEYVLSDDGMEAVCVDVDVFENHFRKYLPVQSYEYYYNNLYNEIVLEERPEALINCNLILVKQYIADNNFLESFKILGAIITALADTNHLNDDLCVTELFPKLGMFLRITYRKGDDKVRDNINEWINHLKENNYYDNCYLEDMILSTIKGAVEK